MTELARRGINELHVEAGAKLNGSLLAERCIDELLLYLAPHLLGGGARGMAELPEITELSARHRVDLKDIRIVGEDIRIIARLTGG